MGAGSAQFANGSNTWLEDMRLIGCGGPQPVQIPGRFCPGLPSETARRVSEVQKCGDSSVQGPSFPTVFDDGHDVQHAVQWKAYRWSVLTTTCPFQWGTKR